MRSVFDATKDMFNVVDNTPNNKSIALAVLVEVVDDCDIFDTWTAVPQWIPKKDTLSNSKKKDEKINCSYRISSLLFLRCMLCQCCPNIISCSPMFISSSV
jgi:hypothetical protein